MSRGLFPGHSSIYDSILQGDFPFWTSVRTTRTRSSSEQTEQGTDEEGNLTFTVEVPGIPAEAVSVELAAGILSVTGEHEGRSVSESFSVGNYSESEVTAKYANGLLTLTLAKAGAEKKQITVTT